MPQKLFLKYVDPKTGKPGLRTVVVLRAWQEGSGTQLFLHANGVYGDKGGAPIKKKQELKIIGNLAQRAQAEKWWDLVGEKLSKNFFEKEDERQKELAERSVSGLVTTQAADIDGLMYQRRPIKDRRKAAFSDPATWPTWFNARPDWWGFASVIELGDWRYEVAGEAGAEEEKEKEEVPPDLTAKKGPK